MILSTKIRVLQFVQPKHLDVILGNDRENWDHCILGKTKNLFPAKISNELTFLPNHINQKTFLEISFRLIYYSIFSRQKIFPPKIY